MPSIIRSHAGFGFIIKLRNIDFGNKLEFSKGIPVVGL